MTPTQADTVISAIKARLPKVQWPGEIWADFRDAMLRVKIDAEQGIVCVKNVILESKFAPTPAHFIEAFKVAQGERPQTCSPVTPEDGYRGEFFHPQGWAVVRGWMWMRAEQNWDKLPALLAEYNREFGVDVDWEDIIAHSAHERFTSGFIQNLGLWVNRKTKKDNPRGSFDLWSAKQRENQERRVKVIAQLRAKNGVNT